MLVFIVFSIFLNGGRGVFEGRGVDSEIETICFPMFFRMFLKGGEGRGVDWEVENVGFS